jgi:integration host factor subunit alpha
MTDSKTLTRAELADAIYREIGLSMTECMEMLDTVLETVIDALTQEEMVKLSAFGTFSVRHKKQRVGRNPKTGIEVPITPRRVVSFHPSLLLKQKINAG